MVRIKVRRSLQVLCGLPVLALLTLLLAQRVMVAQQGQTGPTGDLSVVGEVSVNGLGPGQTLRVTALARGSGRGKAQQREPIVHVTLLDAVGDVIAESAAVTIPHGRFSSIDFPWEGLGRPGDATGRLQVRTQVRYDRLRDADDAPLTTVEVFDSYTGATTLLVGDPRAGRWSPTR